MLAQGWVLYHTRIRLKSCSGTLHSFQSTKTLIESELLEPNSRLQFIADRRDGGGGCSSVYFCGHSWLEREVADGSRELRAGR